jgi:hypothetical protein
VGHLGFVFSGVGSIASLVILLTAANIWSQMGRPAVEDARTGVQTATDVCVAYRQDLDNGIFWNGAEVRAPQVVRFRYSGPMTPTSRPAFLWLPGRDLLKVDFLGIETIESLGGSCAFGF